MTAVWHCPACHDDMPAKFQRSHAVLCAAASALITQSIDRDLQALRQQRGHQ